MGTKKSTAAVKAERSSSSASKGSALRRIKSLPYSQKLAPYIFVMPFILVFAIFYIYPVITTVIMSFQEVIPGQTHFIGLQNFKNLANRDLRQAIKNSVIYTILTLLVVVPVPMLLAVFLNSKKMVAKSFYRSVFFLPALVSIVVGGLTFRLIFGEMPSALINSFLVRLGIAPVKWLGGPAQWTTFFALLILCCWRWTGVNIMYYLAGLQNIPMELYESADIDGANAWQQFRHITVPLLKPTATYVLTISIYGGLAMFLESYMLFNGNRSPGGAGLTIVGYLYRLGWEQANMGFGSAVGLSLLVVTLGINLIQLGISGFFKKED